MFSSLNYLQNLEHCRFSTTYADKYLITVTSAGEIAKFAGTVTLSSTPRQWREPVPGNPSDPPGEEPPGGDPGGNPGGQPGDPGGGDPGDPDPTPDPGDDHHEPTRAEIAAMKKAWTLEYGTTPEDAEVREFLKVIAATRRNEEVQREFTGATSDRERFEALKPLFKESEWFTGVSWKIHAGQWALESAWGRATPKDINTGKESWNFFGYKGNSPGPAGTVDAWTWEEVNGKMVRVVQPFRAYSNVAESIQDHTRLLNTAYYAPVRDCGKDVECAANMLGPDGVGYATDSAYPEKLLDQIHVIESWGE